MLSLNFVETKCCLMAFRLIVFTKLFRYRIKNSEIWDAQFFSIISLTSASLRTESFQKIIIERIKQTDRNYSLTDLSYFVNWI